MYLEKIYLRHFRTYAALALDLAPGVNVFAGPNAAGKTNFLEAVHVLATGTSPRAARDAELVAFGQSGFFLKGLIQRPPSPTMVEIVFDQHKGKAARVDGHPLSSLAALSSHLPVVYFAPDELLTVSGAPVRRRALLDRLLCQCQPAYAYHLERYRFVLQQRNALLHEIRAGAAGRDLLPIWDEQLAAHAGHLVSRRLGAVRELDPLFREEYAHLDPRESPALAYRASWDIDALGPVPPPEALAASLLDALAAQRAVEAARGFTLAGPHRDDLILTIDGRDARLYASQGQRRSLVLALKFACARLIERAVQSRPVLLLDDVFSELDSRRQAHLMERAAGSQVLITCTDREDLEEIAAESGSLFTVSKGEITPIARARG